MQVDANGRIAFRFEFSRIAGSILKFIPTSSLDQFLPPQPYVRATQWNALRESLRPTSRIEEGVISTLDDCLNILEANAIDRCFADNHLGFLIESAQCETSYELGADVQDVSYDLELGLLESVQEIAISLNRRHAPARASTTSQTNTHSKNQ
jgi:hypothetical protein